jgi:serine/threonine protein kinase/lipopolysaccharide biosynthesis regulator YciM
VSLHLVESHFPEALPLPGRFVAASQSRGYVRGGFPICVNCAAPCKKCGIAIRTKEVIQALAFLQGAAWPGVSIAAGNGYCQHIHLLNDLLPRKRQQPFFNPFSTPKVPPSAKSGAQPVSHSHGRSRAPYETGQKIAGKYLIHRIIDGGMGKVFLVSDGGDPFVLKTFTPGAGDPEVFAAEARTWVNLGRHENLVPAFWVDHLAGMMCVAAEFIPADAEGRTTLRDHIRQGPMSPTRALRFAAQFAYGMQHALANGLVAHRDIKPENLLVGTNESLQITDFGIASATPLEWPERASPVRAQGVSGTPPYMAPEQWQGAIQDFRTDVYAFGMVLFELCFGTHPFKAKSLVELSRSHISEPVSVPRHPLADIIGRAVAKDPAERFADPAELLSGLRSVAIGIGAKLPPVPPKYESNRYELLTRASLSSTGNPEHALAAAQLLTEKWPDFASGWTQLGRIRFEQNDLLGAGQATQRAIDLDPTCTAPWNNMGLIYSRLGKYVEAVVAFEAALDCDNQNTGAMLNFAGPLISLGRSDEAIRWLERATTLAPDDFKGWFNLGALLKTLDRQNEAYVAFERAMISAPDHVRTQIAKLIASSDDSEEPSHRVVDIAALLRAEKFDLVMPILEGAAADNPDDPRIWHNLALAYRQQNEWAKSRAALIRLVALEPNNASPVRDLIHACQQEKDWPEALAWCDRLAELPKEEGESQAQRARTLHASGDTPAAVRIIRSAVISFPQSVGVRIAFGDIALAYGAPQMAAYKGYRPAMKMLREGSEAYEYAKLGLSRALAAAELDASTPDE